jgi:glycosyltransferase involved in cell wall biosynthesis
MKIAFIGQKGIPAKNGGVERYVESLATNLADLGQEVLVYNRRDYADKNVYKNIELVSLPALRSKHLEAISHTFLACLDVIRRPVDIIHFQSIGPASLIWLVKIFKPKTPIIFTFHCQDYYHQKWGFFARLYLRLGEKIGCALADQIITISKELTEYVIREYRRTPIYIPNGADLRDKVEAQEIKKWGLSDGNYITYIGRLVRHKGVHYLINAYRQITTDKKLVIVGDGAYTDDYVKELRQAATDNKNIVFTGNQSGRALAELYSNAYLFVQPSESEGLSIALLEAMGYKTACLASDIRANLEALGSAGLTFINTNTDDLRDKIKLTLSDPSLVAAKAAAGYERVKSYFNWSDITRRVLEVYNEARKA